MKKVALASACGATIGYGLSTKFTSGWWVLLASLIGGVFGWIAFDPRGFVRAVLESVSATLVEMSGGIHSILDKPWKQALSGAFHYSIELIMLGQALGTVMVFIYGIMTARLDPPFSPPFAIIVAYGVPIGFGLFLAMLVFVEFLLQKTDNRLIQDGGNLLGHISPVKFLALTNPITMPFTVMWLLVKAMMFLIRRIPIILKFGWIVTVKTCMLAHSDGRLASFAGASLGTVVGTITGFLPVTMIAGAAIGMCAYYIGAFFPESYIVTLTEQLSEETSAR